MNIMPHLLCLNKIGDDSVIHVDTILEMSQCVCLYKMQCAERNDMYIIRFVSSRMEPFPQSRPQRPKDVSITVLEFVKKREP